MEWIVVPNNDSIIKQGFYTTQNNNCFSKKSPIKFCFQSLVRIFFISFLIETTKTVSLAFTSLKYTELPSIFNPSALIIELIR